MYSAMRYDSYMVLKLFVASSDNVLRDIYEKVVDKHNSKIFGEENHLDAGFDLYVPQQEAFYTHKINKLDFSVKCAAVMRSSEKEFPTGFYMYPRSSLSKTPLRLANSVGIIDSGYRGNLIGAFDCLHNYTDGEHSFPDNTGFYLAEKGERLVQICAPGLVPIFVELVDNADALGMNTTRGAGGFGSTSG